MRFIVMHKTNARYESGGLPPEDLINRVGAMLGDLMAAGRFVAGEGLRPTAEGARVTVTPEGTQVAPGPFAGGHELPQGFTIVRAASLEAAVAWAARDAAARGAVETDVRPVTEPWDIGLAPPPADRRTRRWMALRKATRASEQPAPTVEGRRATADVEPGAGVEVLGEENLQPSARGRRYRNTRDGVTAVDGPFTESKELIGGYVIVTADSLDGIDELARRYLREVDTEEVDVRPLEE